MLVRITGQLAEIDEESIVIERDGLARQVLVPRYAMSELATYRGGTITLHTIEYIEGNATGGNLTPRLVGFLHAPDREFFETFVTVKGIGVRKGLRMLSEPVTRIAAMVESSDAAGLSRLPGIGRRTADQIIAELRGKLTTYAMGAVDQPKAAPRDEWTPEQRDALEVMIAWGDARNDAERWLARAVQLKNNCKTPDEWVRAAYRVKSGAVS